MNLCKGICSHFKSRHMNGNSRYGNGQKRCTHCSIFIISQDLRCPCCQTKLRLRSRSNNQKNQDIECLARY